MENIRHSGTPVQALVIGPGRVGASVVEQLAKNPRFHVTWVGKDIQEEKHEQFETRSVVQILNLDKSASPLTINDLIEKYKPDIVFLCQRGTDWDIEDQIASANLERTMLGESAIIADAPVITVSLEQEVQPE